MHSLLFAKEHLEIPLNKGEVRESLIILEKIGLYKGIFKCLGSDGMVIHYLYLNLNLSKYRQV